MHVRGKTAGCLKCTDNETKAVHFGVFIISNNRDSVLSFNVPSAIYDLDMNRVDYGIHFFRRRFCSI